ncbi:MAG: Stealth CR1 domain-containing protein [Oscillospiraceae bacterium]|nr:Stealth CR1 domain-containing protein [Oscillospiraceae bacterium]
MNDKIDFVIIWVDGSDPAWQAEKAKFSNQADRRTDSRIHRFRDWDNLMYWFRGVEKFAPWVNKIHFVTWGHLPKWLNTEHPKLSIVKHTDYIPEKYLPTFSANPIELNLHRIKGLSENFVFFNDDTFIISPVKEEIFFKNNMPCDSAVLNVHCCPPPPEYTAVFNIGLINKYFNMKTVIKENPSKWFNLKYGKQLLRTFALLPCPRFPGMWQHHLPSSLKKTTFEKLWELEYDELDKTCSNKFRTMFDLNQYLIREWQLASGEFYPRRTNVGKNFIICGERFGSSLILGDIYKTENICRFIENQKGKMVCINDEEMTDEEFEENKKLIRSAFDKIMPDKSEFELK